MNTLKDVQIDEISLVDAPANAGATILIYKRDDSTMTADATPAPEIVTKNDDDALQEQLSTLSKSLADLAAENQRLTDENTTLNATRGLWEVAKRDVPQPMPTEDILKNLPEPVAKALADIQKRADDAEALVKRLTDQAEESAYIAKAASYAAIPVAAETLGPLLLRVRKGMSTSADADELERLLAAANTAMEGVITGPVGKSADKAKGGTAMDRLNAAADAIRTQEPTITTAQAITNAMALHPDIYDDYMKERRTNGN